MFRLNGYWNDRIRFADVLGLSGRHFVLNVAEFELVPVPGHIKVICMSHLHGDVGGFGVGGNDVGSVDLGDYFGLVHLQSVRNVSGYDDVRTRWRDGDGFTLLYRFLCSF